jgi:lipopolysaccharide transport system ATP-binding protein
MKPAIEVKGLGKSYIINHKEKTSYSTLKDDFTHLFTAPFERSDSREEKFWALKDVSFDVMPGEIFGVIGRNGSGKSTLLKILSRIVDPTEGEITMRGRVASLLEVGTGFHPELTGRENIYFNGSMLGMSRKEIDRKFDEIVAFSEVEKFIDTPVKFYSSGMYVRLAFSVAAHLGPDILILDEVLSVGDAGFQKKSLQKITETMENGTTVLFVSHSMDSVQKLCSRGLLLDSGHLRHVGDTDSIVDEYKDIVKPGGLTKRKRRFEWKNDGTIGIKQIKPIRTYITDENGNVVKTNVRNDTNHYFNVEVEVMDDSQPTTVGYVVHNEHSSVIYVSANTDRSNTHAYHMRRGRQTVTCKIPKHLLNEGGYSFSLYGGITHKLDWFIQPESKDAAIDLTIEGGLSESPQWRSQRSGFIAPQLEWNITKEDS